MFFYRILYSRVRVRKHNKRSKEKLISWFNGGQFDVATFSDSLGGRACVYPVSLHGCNSDVISVPQQILTIIAVFSRQLLPAAVSHHFLWNIIQVTGLQKEKIKQIRDREIY